MTRILSGQHKDSKMANKPKIHVFLGAPCPQALSLEVQERGVQDWKTVDLTWSQGRLIPKDTVIEVQTDDECGAVTSGRPESAGTSERIPESTADKTETSQDDSTPSGCECSQSKAESVEVEDLCPVLVTEYLDSCFSCPQTLIGQSRDIRPSPPVSTETEYLSTWTKSQALRLRSRVARCPASGFLEDFLLGSPHDPHKQMDSTSISSPDLYSSNVSPEERGLGGTLQSSGEWHNDSQSQSQRQEERGVILEITSDGILCSQGNALAERPVAQEELGLNMDSPTTTAQASPSPTTSKRMKLSQTVSKTKGTTDQRVRSAAPLCGPTTLLARCKTHGVRYAILVAVVHPCHLKEVKVKTGVSAGSSVPLATLVVTDQSNVEMKVVLWRTAAFWALTVYPGDILLITDVTVHIDKWKTETVLQSSFSSKLLNLGQVTGDRVPLAPQNLNCHTLRMLCTHLCEKRPLLVSLPPHKPQDLNSIPFIRLVALRPDTLVHALLRVKHRKLITAWRDEAEGISRAGGVLKAILSVEQGDGHQGAVILWGAALSWLQRLDKNKDAVWEFRMLLVRQDVTSGLLELHSTPWSTCQPLFPDDSRCKEFYNTVRSQRTASSFEIDLNTLLSQKYSGDVELKIKITAFQFQSSSSQEASLLIDSNTPMESILDVVCGDITFAGCGQCSAELETDENGIYRPCYPCLPHTGVRRYYRPVFLTVRAGDDQICVQVPPALVQKILLNTPPDKLHKTIAPASEVKFIQVVANRISSMLTPTKNTFLLTVRSHFQCDENSIPIIQNFLLLDFSSPEAC